MIEGESASPAFRSWPLIRHWLGLRSWQQCGIVAPILWFARDAAWTTLQRLPAGDFVLLLYFLILIGCLVHVGYAILVYLVLAIDAKSQLDQLRRERSVVATLPLDQRLLYEDIRFGQEVRRLPLDEARKRYPEFVRRAEQIAATATPEELSAALHELRAKTRALNEELECRLAGEPKS